MVQWLKVLIDLCGSKRNQNTSYGLSTANCITFGTLQHMCLQKTTLNHPYPSIKLISFRWKNKLIQYLIRPKKIVYYGRKPRHTFLTCYSLFDFFILKIRKKSQKIFLGLVCEKLVNIVLHLINIYSYTSSKCFVYIVSLNLHDQCYNIFLPMKN